MPSFLNAQNIVKDTLSTDAKFKQAQNYAYNKERDKAKAICRKLIAEQYTDAYVLLGRIYSWDGAYDSSRAILNEILKIKPLYYDAIDALIDVDYWDNKDEQALVHVNEALLKYKEDANLMLKKAKILNSLNNQMKPLKFWKKF